MIYLVSPAEDLSDGEEVLPKEIAKWNSNDLMDKIEAADTEETPGMMEMMETFIVDSQTSSVLDVKNMRVCVCRGAVQGNDSGL